MTEIEAKFLLHDGAQVSQVLDLVQAEGFGIEEAATLDILDRYFDTSDWRLYRAGWAYRWQNSSGRLKLALKSLSRSDSAVQVREETEQLVNEFPASPGEYPEGPVSDLLQPVLKTRVPEELFRVHKDRKRYFLRNGTGTVIELALDRTHIRSARIPEPGVSGEIRFWELELEMMEGDPSPLHQLVDALQDRLALLRARLNKYERGLQASTLLPPRKPLVTALAVVHAGDPLVRLAYRALADQLQGLLENESATWEGIDPESLHRMRVAARRLQEAFRLFRPVLPPRALASFRRDFQWLARILGAVRDLDVYQQNFERYAVLIPPEDSVHLQVYRQALGRQWEKARHQLEATLSSRRYERLLRRFARFLERGPSKRALESGRPQPVFLTAPRMINRRTRRVLRRGRAVQRNATPQALHQLRIRCKRLRYACEFFQPVYGERFGPFIVRLKVIQDILGEHQDACVASERLRAYADRVPFRMKNRGLLVALGQLVSSQQHLAAAKREMLLRAWKRFDKKKIRQKLKQAFYELGYRKETEDEPPSAIPRPTPNGGPGASSPPVPPHGGGA
ncbi:MAG: CHAD domain-containing protein [Planctomycetes bacterium]|nr:CHAD domain-containing protein [Planctomycetota bacterium]